MHEINLEAYRFEEHNFEDGMFDACIDATFIIHLENNGRLEHIQKQLTDFIQANISDSGNASINLITFCYICDKVLVESSRETSASKYNFYQMFYDEVLKRQHVAYAVSSFKNGILSYNFYTQVNWAQEYHNWIALRNQSSTNVFNAPIGLDV
jgi:hypothetical protein